MTTQSPRPEAPTLHLTLAGADAASPADHRRIDAVGGLRAALRLEGDGPSAHLALPQPAASSRAELRWLVDGILRKVRGLLGRGPVTLRATADLDDATVRTLALDLHHGTRGRLTLEGRDEVAADVRRWGASEDLYRAWVNEDPATRTSLAIARDVQAWAEGRGDVSVDVLTEPRLEEEGLRLLLAVGQGSSASPSRLVVATHTPPGAKGQRPWMLLGKGITFDSGGINVKPYESFVSTMKNDMGGAAIAWSLFKAWVERGADRPLVLVLPTCENAVGAASMRPGALVKSYRGHVVRIDHTDAEGRLVMADGLAWASDKYDPAQVVTFATLTTAALIAYGPYATPVHFADASFRATLEAASEATGEDMHFLPFRRWHFEANRDKEGDLRNTARLPAQASRGAGSRNAAHFLQHFTDAPLCHLDIFGSTWNWAGDAPGAGYGATGAPLRTLLHAFGL